MKIVKLLFHILLFLWFLAFFMVSKRAELPTSVAFSVLSLVSVLIISLLDIMENIIKLKNGKKFRKVLGMRPALFLLFLLIAGPLLATVEIFIFGKIGITKTVGP